MRRFARSSILADKRGAHIVEFAVIAPVFFTILFAGFDWGHTLYAQSILQGAVNKSARDSTLETGSATARQAALDARVLDQVSALNKDISTTNPNARITFDRKFFRTFTNAAAPSSETFTDTDGNGSCNAGEPYVDQNNNGIFDVTGIAAGQGGTNDAVIYTVTVTYPRLFPMAGLLGWPNDVTLRSSTVLANQPYGTRGAPVTRNCL